MFEATFKLNSRGSKYSELQTAEVKNSGTTIRSGDRAAPVCVEPCSVHS